MVSHKTNRYTHFQKGKSYAIFAFLLIPMLLFMGIFFGTRGANPAVSELAFTERSTIAGNIGSVLPASCESSEDHGGTQTCSDGSTISICGSCPAVTCNSYNYDNSSEGGGCKNTWTNTYNYCTDGTTWTDEGVVTTVCEPVCTNSYDGGSYNDGCAVITWSAVYTTCGNSTTESRTSSRDESGCVVATPPPPIVSPPPPSTPPPPLVSPPPPPLEPKPWDLCYWWPPACIPKTPPPAAVSTPAPAPITPPAPPAPAPIPSGCGPGTLNDDCYVPYPDLTAGSIPPTRTPPGESVTLSSTIRNQGDESTGTWFYNFIQIATETDGGGTVTDFPPESMGTLPYGGQGTISLSHTFTTKGRYSARACADKSNSGNSGRIGESNEGNNCSPWTTIVVAFPPKITDVSLEFPNITFVCHDSENYTVTHGESGTVIGQGQTSDRATVSVMFSEEGNYSLVCISDLLTASAVVNYTIPAMVLSGLSISANPKTVNNNKSTTLSWSILNPRNTCSLRAEAVCAGGRANCSQLQLTDEKSLNDQLQGSTDNNDQYGAGRNVQTAVKTVYTKYSNKALGKKTLLMNTISDFVLDCGTSQIDGTPLIKKIRVNVSSENEG